MSIQPGQTQPQNLHSPPVTIVLTVVLLVFFLLGFFSIYFCRCLLESIFSTWYSRRAPSGNLVGATSDVAANNGLDPSFIKLFPTFVYSSIKEFRKENYDLECAICLVEFHDQSLLRLLTVCYHVFHQECVDLWLDSHKTCPVCRRDLDAPPPLPPEAAAEKTPVEDSNVQSSSGEDTRIDVKDDQKVPPLKQSWKEEDEERRRKILKSFSRSHSTGHSISRTRSAEEGKDEDKYTLRLPDNLKMKLLRGHHLRASCGTYGEFSRHKSCINGGFGEVSSFGVNGDVNRV
ncbi:hypothetical protein UlMin_001157 [Ulmus minor]